MMKKIPKVAEPDVRPENLAEVPRHEGTATVDVTRIGIANPEKKMAVNYWNWVRNLSFLGAFILIVYGFYITFRDIKVLEVFNEPVPLVDDTLHPGEPIVLNIDFEKYVAIPAIVYPQLVCTGTFPRNLPSFPSNLVAKRQQIPFSYGTVPLSMPPSESCYLRVTVQYFINALNYRYYTFESDRFEVLGGQKILHLEL